MVDGPLVVYGLCGGQPGPSPIFGLANGKPKLDTPRGRVRTPRDDVLIVRFFHFPTLAQTQLGNRVDAIALHTPALIQRNRLAASALLSSQLVVSSRQQRYQFPPLPRLQRQHPPRQRPQGVTPPRHAPR